MADRCRLRFKIVQLVNFVQATLLGAGTYNLIYGPFGKTIQVTFEYSVGVVTVNVYIDHSLNGVRVTRLTGGVSVASAAPVVRVEVAVAAITIFVDGVVLYTGAAPKAVEAPAGGVQVVSGVGYSNLTWG